ncbi:unnamed protein product [Cylicocyclus nassatus]|uniref:Uncharacterized protein n=1 Tax=Cylicocyclus nassatus TaxID=53992 RepID=A0AA36M9Z0_CYLNA|nr:unnamed protein product [Cylicocyclus nassatus]
MASTVRCLKGLVAKRNDAAMNWLQDSMQALTDIQAKESARRIKTCERYIELLETSLTKLTKAFDEAPETTEEEEDHLDKYIEKTQATIMKLHDHRTQLEETLEDIGIEADDRSSPYADTSPIDEGASRTFEPETATTLLLRQRHTAAPLHPEGTTMHELRNYDSREARDLMQMMNQHFETLVREMENGFKAIREEINRHHDKTQGVNAHREHPTLARTMQPRDKVKRGHVKNRRLRGISLTTSQRRSNTVTSLQKERSSKELRRNIALASEETQKQLKPSSLHGQRIQTLARSKEKETQKWVKRKKPKPALRVFAGHAGAYELHSYQFTRPSRHGAKHSNARESTSDEKYGQGQRQAHTRPKNRTVDTIRKLARREESQSAGEKAITVLERESDDVQLSFNGWTIKRKKYHGKTKLTKEREAK